MLQLGSDANAQMLREALTQLGADLSHVRTVEGPTGSAVILLQPSGAAPAAQGPAMACSKPSWRTGVTWLRTADDSCAGENSILVVGGANQADWALSEGARQVTPSPAHPTLRTHPR